MTRPWTLIAFGFVLGEILAATAGWIGMIPLIALAIIGIITGYKEAISKKIWLPIVVLSLSAICGSSRWYIAGLVGPQEHLLDDMASSNEADTYCHKVNKIEYKDDRIIIYMGHLLVYADCDIADDIHIGNTVNMTGKITNTSRASNPGQFDYAMYYRAKGITHTCFADDIVITERSMDYISTILLRWKTSAMKEIEEICEPQDAGFLQAALLGDKSHISDDDYDMYRNNGIAHLLAISGLHVGILGLGLYELLRRKIKLGFVSSGILAGISLIVYTIMTGGSVSVCRSVAMLILYFIAEAIGRTGDMLNTACIVGLGILIVSPYELMQCGFQLSLLAVIAIGGPAASIIARYKIKNPIVSALVISISVQLVTLPTISWFFYTIPLYATLLNIVVIPLMGLVVWAGLLVICLGYISAPLAYIPAGSVHYVICIYRWLCMLIQKLPYATVTLGRMKLWQIVLYSGLLISVWWMIVHNKTKKTPIVQVLLVCIALAIVYPVENDMTETVYLDVGQGDGIYIRDGGRHILIDSGSSSNKKIGEQILEPFLLSRAVDKIDMVFLTHADMDHINGVEYLLSESNTIHIDRLILPDPAREDDEYNEIKAKATEAKTEIIYLGGGDNIDMPYGSIRCLAPEKNMPLTFFEGDSNKESLVLLYTRDEYRQLLMGDADISVERSVCENYSTEIKNMTVLKVGHHGSSTSSSEGLMDISKPRIAILSYGMNNRYGHPHVETVELLNRHNAYIYRTAEDGAISIYTDGTHIEVSTYN